MTEDLKVALESVPVGEETLAEAQAADEGLPQAPEAEEEAATESVEPPKHKWQIGVWKGFPNYKCPGKNPKTGHPCVFVTIDLPLLEDHVEKVHQSNWLEGV